MKNSNIVIPTRDTAVMEQLDACLIGALEQRHGGASLPTEMVTLISETATDFRTQYEDLQLKRSRFVSVNREMRTLEKELKTRIRHAFQGFRRHLQALQAAVPTLNSFGLKEDGFLPEHNKTIREPIQLAKNILNAHSEVEAAGASYLFDPTPGELQARIDALELLRLDRQSAKDDEQEALALMRAMRERANRLLLSVRQYLMTMSTGLDALGKRQMLRSFGYKYQSHNGRDVDATPDEPVSGEDQPSSDAETGGEPGSDADDAAPLAA